MCSVYNPGHSYFKQFKMEVSLDRFKYKDKTNLNNELNRYSNGRKRLDVNGQVFKCHLNTGQLNHLNTGQMDAILFSYVLVPYSNDWSRT